MNWSAKVRVIWPLLVPEREILAPFRGSNIFFPFHICTASFCVSTSVLTGSSHWWGKFFYISVWGRKDADWVLVREDSQLTKKYIHNAWCFSFKKDDRRKRKYGLNISSPYLSYLDIELNSLTLDCLLHEFTCKPRQTLLVLPFKCCKFCEAKDVLFLQNLKVRIQPSFFLGFLLIYSVQTYKIISGIFFYHFEITYIDNDRLAEFLVELKRFFPQYFVYTQISSMQFIPFYLKSFFCWTHFDSQWGYICWGFVHYQAVVCSAKFSRNWKA